MSVFQSELDQILAECRSSSYLDHIEQLRNTFSECKLVLYGAGELGKRTAKWLMQHEIKADCFCDRSLSGTHSDLGLPIISPKELLSSFENANIIICSIAHAGSIKKDLINLGISEEHIFHIDQLQIHDMTVEDFLPYVKGYEWAYNFFEDNTSKEIILKRIKGYLLSSSLEPSKNTEYFDEEILSLNTDEVFIDGGVFTGDTAIEFIEFTKGNYHHYYGFEIDPDNYDQACKNLANQKNITLTKKGLWSEDAELRIQANLAASSKLSESGDDIALVTSLDSFFKTEADQPTLIKLDIEGAEKEALEGMENIIKNGKPKLAICAYHKPEDIYVLTKLLDDYDVGYQFSLRHYSNSLHDTVLYAT